MSWHFVHHISSFPCPVTFIAISRTAASQWSQKMLINLTWPSWPHWGKFHWSASCSHPGHSGKLSLLPCIGCKVGCRPPSPPSSQTAEPVRDSKGLCCVWIECVAGGGHRLGRQTREKKVGTRQDRGRWRDANIFTQEAAWVGPPVWTGGICALTLGSTSQWQAAKQDRSQGLSLLRRAVPM